MLATLVVLLTPLPLLATMVQHAWIKLWGKGMEESVLRVETTWKLERCKCYIDPSDKNIWHAAQRWWGRALVFQIFTHLHQSASLVLPELWGTSYSHLNDPKKCWEKVNKKLSCRLEGEILKEVCEKFIYSYKDLQNLMWYELNLNVTCFHYFRVTVCLDNTLI